MNIVSIKNTGYPSVFSFCVADGWITIETSENFTWFLKKLKDVVDVGLTGSCEEVFPEAKKLLCQVRLRRSIRTKPLTYFGMKNNVFDNKTTGIKEAVTSDRLFEVVKDMYSKAALASSDPKKVMEYLGM
ncbi:hypothetical protein CU097_011769 [Rhizopus azygosporus]|uniref:Uncharacterized protein n=1 Tax=Rhizopus azygosporus TaxID=86630 RepID=A0A367JSG3_RHIAZ|nr:hypothetical protein CU097_011769 [Rhizopus azygosporus]